MPLPKTIAVKIISEAAGYISITPVARQDLAAAELVERILSVTGKKPSRIRDILSRGSFVSGSSRYRWEPVEADSAELAAMLDRFPDKEPDRPFEASKCAKVVLEGRRGSLELDPETASKRRLFKKQSFWDVLLATLDAARPDYHRYSYSAQADVYQVRLSLETRQSLQVQTRLLKYGSIAKQMQFLEPDVAELFTKR